MLRPDRAASKGLTCRRASKVVPGATGMTRSVASSAEFLIGDPLGRQALEQRWGHQHDADPGVRQPSVDLAEQRLGEADVLLAEQTVAPRNTSKITQLSRGTVPVVPGVAEDEVATLRARSRACSSAWRAMGSIVRHSAAVYDRTPLHAARRDLPPPDEPPLDDPPPPLQEGLGGGVL